MAPLKPKPQKPTLAFGFWFHHVHNWRLGVLAVRWQRRGEFWHTLGGREINPRTKKTSYHYYSGAFDIVLNKVPIFEKVPGVEGNKQLGRRQAFGVFAKAMRDHGIVAWHRWAGEGDTTSENEMHCIDPATPFLKHALGSHVKSRNDKIKGQIGSFLNRGTGGGYPDEPQTGPFAITIGKGEQTDKVRDRFFNPLVVPGAQPDNLSP